MTEARLKALADDWDKISKGRADTTWESGYRRARAVCALELRAVLATPAPAQPEEIDHIEGRLSALLALIHGDVGRYEAEHGTVKACFDAEAKLLARSAGAAAPVEGAAWQGIETAPKDGKDILVLTKECGALVVFWNDYEKQWDDGLSEETWTPTCWMPIPATLPSEPEGESAPPALKEQQS